MLLLTRMQSNTGTLSNHKIGVCARKYLPSRFCALCFGGQVRRSGNGQLVSTSGIHISRFN